MASSLKNSASGKACQCAVKDKSNWLIAGITHGFPKGYVVRCLKCRAQWNTKAKYCENLRKASWIKQ